jgi:arabinogalactan oligomer / maltooligosaccharide transport system permease protein
LRKRALEDCRADLLVGKSDRGVGQPFAVRDPAFKNYIDLLGGFFEPDGLLALGRIVVTILPLVGAGLLNRRLDRGLTRPVAAGVVWLGGLVLAVVVAWLIDARTAYDTLLNSGDFIMVNVRTIIYVAVCMPLFFSVGLAMALILNNPNLRAVTAFRVILIVPWAASTVAIMMTLVWQFFFRQQGTINQIIQTFFANFSPPAYLNNTTWAFIIVVLVNVWYTYPFFMVTLLGGLQSIPLELYEAAEVDGAGWWRQLAASPCPSCGPWLCPSLSSAR